MTNADRNRSEKASHASTLMPWILIGLALGAVGGAILAHQKLEKSSKYLSQ
jgi:hypothetical protein